jgi:plasmid stability protein
MSITLDLPEELENELSVEAAQAGLSLEEYALRVLSTGLIVGKRPQTGAELVEYWQNEGLIGARPDIIDSQAHSRQVRERAERRTRA